MGVAPSSGSAAFVIGGNATAALLADNRPADDSYVPPIVGIRPRRRGEWPTERASVPIGCAEPRPA